MRKLLLIFLFIPTISCFCENMNNLNFLKIKHQDYFSDNDSLNAISIDLEYFHLSDTLAVDNKINATIDSVIFSKLGVMDAVIPNYQAYFDSVKDEYHQMRKDFPEARSINFQQVCKGDVPVLKDNILSFFLINYVFSGGAHGMEFHEFWNFDIQNGKIIDITSQIENLDKFRQIAEIKLRQKFGMSESDNWSDFTFIDEFVLPKNIGLTEMGYRLVYNPYEILSYAEGHTELFIGFDELK